MLRIELDTCVLFDAIVNTWRPKYQEDFYKLYQLHPNKFSQVIILKTVQAEFYGILRPGRTELLIGIPFYKHNFYKVVLNHMGWDNWGLDTIVIHTRKIKTKQYGNIDDKYDYPHMASALVDDEHLLITDNLKNFARSLGPCLAVGMKLHLLAGKLEIDDEYLDKIDIDADNTYQ